MMRRWLVPGLLLVLPLQAAGFDPVKDVPVALAEGVLMLTVPPGVHLKVATFRITLASQGTLQPGPLPPATDRDEAGDPIWRGTLRVALRGRDLEDPARVTVIYQPCTEGPDAVCYLPVKRTLVVAASEVPAGTP
jgi:hypothetical protein